MIQERKASFSERIRGWIYSVGAYIVVFVIADVGAISVHCLNLMDPLVKGAPTLATTGATVAAFLFTIQGILISVPKENPFMRQVRNNTRYLVYLHRFCLVAEVAFMAVLLPMHYMDISRPILNVFVLTVFIGAVLFTIWSMWLMCRILIFCEKHANDSSL